MKLVIQVAGKTNVRHVPEFEFESTIGRIMSNYCGKRVTPLPYEAFRYKLKNGVIYITKTKRRDMARKRWFETRALALLARERRESFQRNLPVKVGNFATEVDGVGCESGVVVEATRTKVTQRWLEFYSRKRRALGSSDMIVMAQDFSDDITCPSNLSLYKVKLDWDIIQKFYRNYSFPSWFRRIISSRHVRFLMSNGLWKGVSRSLTYSAKHTPESKLQEQIKKFWRTQVGPVKAYYSQASLVNPPREFRGKGYPLSRVVMAFDIDSRNHTHQIGSEGYCLICMKDAKKHLSLATKHLHDMGYETISLVSGTKGYHIYCIHDSNVIECDLHLYEEVLANLGSITDSFTFRNGSGSYDIHRILKLPGSVDCETGLLVEEAITRLPLQDSIIEQ